jgi:hypothetical protein
LLTGSSYPVYPVHPVTHFFSVAIWRYFHDSSP